jgi:hypothetical protein
MNLRSRKYLNGAKGSPCTIALRRTWAWLQ